MDLKSIIYFTTLAISWKKICKCLKKLKHVLNHLKIWLFKICYLVFILKNVILIESYTTYIIFIVILKLVGIRIHESIFQWRELNLIRLSIIFENILFTKTYKYCIHLNVVNVNVFDWHWKMSSSTCLSVENSFYFITIQ